MTGQVTRGCEIGYNTCKYLEGESGWITSKWIFDSKFYLLPYQSPTMYTEINHEYVTKIMCQYN